MNKYFLTREAKEDLWRIYEYGVRQFGEAQADIYFNLLNDCFEKIASNPFMFPEYIHQDEHFRYCVCGVDTIYYKVEKDHVEIVTIIGRQDYR